MSDADIGAGLGDKFKRLRCAANGRGRTSAPPARRRLRSAIGCSGQMFASPTHARTYAGPLWVRRRHTRHVNYASALPLKADIHRGRLDVSYGPIGDIEETILAPPCAS